ncbi:hypothetical protein EDM00_08140 [Ornithobacterium rhinotracheale]|uniref:hypothetical protein n=1 Tax=Ornithobacterium rhinotracheale TaxID=28251 RepID=UPI00129CC5EE|nr:hypothetical protein [Ornithobacterium rhinotracheale]MRI63955.1 hypothetical protein [Ornithobacterium rhinotracheale]
MKRINLILLLSIILQSCATQKESHKDFSMVEKILLPEKIDEISGLEIQDSLFWGFNDSGGDAKIYAFNPSQPAKIHKTVEISNAKNKDWEDIAIGDSLVFIGDFGNNYGNRKDLRIYYFNKEILNSPAPNASVVADTINFFYPEQKNYNPKPHKHDFDTEAMFYFGGKIHVFTKEWVSAKTHHYTLDVLKGKQPAWLVEEYNTGFLVTAADAKMIDGKLYITFVGYTKGGKVYLLMGEADPNTPDFKFMTHGKFKKYHLGFAGDMGQVEGVKIVSNKKVWVSAERFKQKIYNSPQNITSFQLK